MPEKEWTVAFGEFALIVRRTTVRGDMSDFAVVLLAHISGEWTNITRYDTAHGTPHRDILGANQGCRGRSKSELRRSKSGILSLEGLFELTPA